MSTVVVAETEVGEVRYIRSGVTPERVEHVLDFWRTRGREVIESAEGCHKALGFFDPESTEFVLMIWWRSAEDAERFRLSEYHEREFVQGLGEGVTRLTRTHLTPLDQGEPSSPQQAR